MPKYVLVYRAAGGLAEDDVERDEHMAAWGTWFGSLGADVVDGGNPLAASVSVAADGTATEGALSGLTGYSIVAAESLERATAIAQACPIVTFGGSIDVYETVIVDY
jgi:hypothetical protein